MSTGFSGNLGYPIPKNWAFDQFFEFKFSSSPTFPLDKDAYSGRDKGVTHFDKVKYKSPKELEKEQQKEALYTRRLQYIYDIMDPLGLKKNFVTTSISFGKEYPLAHYDYEAMTIDVSAKFTEEYSLKGNESFKISVDESGKLTASCKNEIAQISKDMDTKVKGVGIEDKLENLALSIKSGYITVEMKNISVNQLSISMEISSDGLLPNSDVDAGITCELIYLITLKNKDVQKPSFDWKPVLVVGLATALVASMVFTMGADSEVAIPALMTLCAAV